MPKDMMVADEGLVMGDSIIVNIDTVMNIGTTPVIASVVHGMALITPHNVVTINVNTIETGLDEICTKTVSSPWIMVVRPICGNDYLRLEMSEPMLTLAPNPSDGDVIIHSSEEVIVADAMGREVPVESEHSNEPGDGLITRAHKLATGVYVVRLKYTGAKAARFVVSR
jgi:hypothetical protein